MAGILVGVLSRSLATLAIVATTFLGATLRVEAGARVALVIGNSDYRNAPALKNPRNDAADFAEKLRGLGFDVITGTDLDLEGMRKSIREFAKKIDRADLAVFFYAGHGVQVNGENYLIPTDAQLSQALDLEFEAIPMKLAMSAMEDRALANLIFLDACRDSPFVSSLARSTGTRSEGGFRGLAKLETGVGTLIAFATQPGNVALDGAGRNSPFTSALLKHLGKPGRDISRELVAVRKEVLTATDGRQVPWENSSLTGEIILSNEATPEQVSSTGDHVVELAYWDTIKNSGNAEYFNAYLQRYPDGLFTDIAKLKLKESSPSAPTSNDKKVASVGALESYSTELTDSDQSPFDSTKIRGLPGSFGSAAKVAMVQIAMDADPRLIKALEALKDYELRFGVYRGNLYIAVLTWGTTWEQSKQLAASAGGHLVSIGDVLENQFVFDLFSSDWRFMRDRRRGAEQIGPFIGLLQPENAKEPLGGWQWVNGLPLRFSNWHPQQPREVRAGQDVASFYGFGRNSRSKDKRTNRWASVDKSEGAPGFIVEIEGQRRSTDQPIVVQVQSELARLGCLAGPVDGEWGTGSRKALQEFFDRTTGGKIGTEPTTEALKSLRETSTPFCQ